MASRLTDEMAAARDLLRLCTGRAPVAAADAVAWRRVADLAVRQRCGPLLWHHGRAWVRAGAPPDVQRRLQAHAIDRAEHERRRLELALTAVDELARAGVPAIVHKGIALAARLHGDAFVRPSADVDLLVDAAQRAAARAVLEGLGFRRLGGAAPLEEVFEGPWRGGGERIELHSLPFGDRLAHLPQPPARREWVQVEGVRVPCLPLASAGLAMVAHYALEWQPPLLLALDLRALAERQATDAVLAAELRSEATAARASRYLAYGGRVAQRVSDGLADDDDRARRALEALGIGRPRGILRHPAVRALVLGESWGDRHAGVAAWVVSPLVGRDGAREGWRERARRVVRSIGAASKASGDGVVRTLDASPHELTALVSDVVQRGGRCWIGARGRSMTPAIPEGASILLSPAPARLRRGDVALATLPNGSVVVHRVLTDDGVTVRLQGDANVTADRPAPRSAVHAVVERVRVAGREFPIARRPGPSLRIRLGRLRARMRPLHDLTGLDAAG